jgi:hypothetical protein
MQMVRSQGLQRLTRVDCMAAQQRVDIIIFTQLILTCVCANCLTECPGRCIQFCSIYSLDLICWLFKHANKLELC